MFLNSINKCLIYLIKQLFVDVVAAIKQVLQSEPSGGAVCNFDAPKTWRLPECLPSDQKHKIIV